MKRNIFVLFFLTLFLIKPIYSQNDLDNFKLRDENKDKNLKSKEESEKVLNRSSS